LNLGQSSWDRVTIRELVGERTIFRREQAAGLSTSAYVWPKIGVFGAAA